MFCFNVKKKLKTKLNPSGLFVSLPHFFLLLPQTQCLPNSASSYTSSRTYRVATLTVASCGFACILEAMFDINSSLVQSRDGEGINPSLCSLVFFFCHVFVLEAIFDMNPYLYLFIYLLLMRKTTTDSTAA